MAYHQGSNNGEKAMEAARHNNNGCGTHHGDPLSSIPDPILIEILSLLPIKTAVTTSVLSHQWRGLWTQTLNLDIDTRHFPNNFFTIVDHILGQQQLTSPQIRKFKLRVLDPITHSAYWASFSSYIQRWMSVISGRNVEQVEVISDKIMDIKKLLSSSPVFECHSLVSLNLSQAFQFRVPDEINLPNLKIFNMRLYGYDSEWIKKLLRSCPLLEGLSLQGRFSQGEHFVEISSPNLKRLTFHILKQQGRTSIKIAIDAPKLSFFDLWNFFGVNLWWFVNQPSSSSFEMRISGTRPLYQVSTTLELFQEISNVRSLTLNSPFISNLDSWDDPEPPTLFHNLSSLSLSSMHYPNDFKVLLVLLHCAPNLEFLTIRMSQGARKADISLIPFDSPPPCLLTHVKRIHIGLTGLEDEMEMVKYLLCNANVLECLNVELDRKGNSKEVQLEKELNIYEDLCKLPKSSPSCHISICSSNGGKKLRIMSRFRR